MSFLTFVFSIISFLTRHKILTVSCAFSLRWKIVLYPCILKSFSSWRDLESTSEAPPALFVFFFFVSFYLKNAVSALFIPVKKTQEIVLQVLKQVVNLSCLFSGVPLVQVFLRLPKSRNDVYATGWTHSRAERGTNWAYEVRILFLKVFCLKAVNSWSFFLLKLSWVRINYSGDSESDPWKPGILEVGFQTFGAIKDVYVS